MEGSPIINRIGQVFIPVSDIERSAEWYKRLFGVDGGHLGHHDQIYDVPMQGEARLCLDAHKPLTGNSVQPICFFWTADMNETRNFLLENDVELASEVEDVGSLSFIMFKDPDNNLLMVCEPKSEETCQRAGM